MPKRDIEVTDEITQPRDTLQNQITAHDIAEINRKLALHHQFARRENLAARDNNDARTAVDVQKADRPSPTIQNNDVGDSSSHSVRKLTRTLAHLEDYPAEYVQRFADLMSLLQSMDLTTDDLRTLLVVLSRANTYRLSSEGYSDLQATLTKSVVATQNNAHTAPATISTEGPIPPLSTAPRDTFRGVRHDGDPYVFLMKHFGPWLQDGRKCLDRPTLKRLDRRLMKALEQRYTRGDNSIPPLSQIFPSKTEAARNRHIEAAA